MLTSLLVAIDHPVMNEDGELSDEQRHIGLLARPMGPIADTPAEADTTANERRLLLPASRKCWCSRSDMEAVPSSTGGTATA
ncbi:hypothetical protein [Microvirga lotononidis]|uniref:hypothetical protein n=1 Tax=Microvirga lotononidis TaxID=864069 RepID=UPI00058B9845|nr:hypothetical protein [Microvirga lotononidis]WQO31376.1 hypothetical protein U0023_34385 [Microvirga lotononidis]